VGWPPAVVPGWADNLLTAYSDAGALVGHGVSFSPLSAGVDEYQRSWLTLLRQEFCARRYRHLSEHFGFSTTRNFHQSAPLPVPLTPATLTLGQDRLRQLAAAAGVPIGLENLAFAFSVRDVEEQGRFLDRLLAAVAGFVVLDLHNLYCQSMNFHKPLEALLAGYPLKRVRELHVAGGSWSQSESSPASPQIRRDTHDQPVPKELFAWLPYVLQRCPDVEVVILERMGGTLTEADDEAFRRDFRRLREVVHACG
jgi:uncharacterized protein (UPF0276 family)